MIDDVCSSIDLVFNSTLPLAAIASMITGLIIAIGYMFGEATHNVKASLWAKTEILQLFVSIFVFLLTWAFLQSYCQFNLDSISSLFTGLSAGVTASSSGTFNIFEGAVGYCNYASSYVETLISATRYHLTAYNTFQMHSLWQCEDNEYLSIIMCIFGFAFGFGGGSGVSISPDSGHALASSAMTMVFNTLLFDMVSLLNYYFILKFILSGFVFFFLPLGIFLRSFPYMRNFGSLLMAISLSFLFVYPLILSVFYLDFVSANSVLLPAINDKPPFDRVFYYSQNEARLEDMRGISNQGFDQYFYNDIFGDHGGSAETDILQLAGNAFLVSVFLPTFALLATFGSVMYVNRLLGQEIDLNRIMQMV
jgi:hypothetical protein